MIVNCETSDSPSITAITLPLLCWLTTEGCCQTSYIRELRDAFDIRKCRLRRRRRSGGRGGPFKARLLGLDTPDDQRKNFAVAETAKFSRFAIIIPVASSSSSSCCRWRVAFCRLHRLHRLLSLQPTNSRDLGQKSPLTCCLFRGPIGPTPGTR